MAKRRKSSPAKRRQKQLQRTHEGSQGQKLYNVTAGKVTDKEIKWMAQTINRRLRALEKSGLSQESNEYRLIKQYATGDPSGKGSIYNITPEGNVRITSTAKRGGSGPGGKMTSQEKAYLVTVMRNIMNAKTSTVGGTKAALNKAYESAKAVKEEMTFDQYVEVWRAWRDNVSKDKRDHASSQIVMKLIKQYDFYNLDRDQLDTAFSYYDQYDDPASWADDLVTAPEEREVTSPFTGETLTLYSG